MKILMTLLFTIATAQVANAASRPEPLESIPAKVLVQMEKNIKSTVQQRSGFKTLTEFNINWDEVSRCLEVYNEMNDSTLGTCTVKFSAFQIAGEALVIVKDNGYSTSVLYVNVE